jgi:hypothetical protein
MVKHSLAHYPKQFTGCVVSPNKICLQWEDVQVKLMYKEGGEYIKLPSTAKALPIAVTGTDVHYTAVGGNIQTVIKMQQHLIEAYKKYTLEYDEGFVNILQSFADQLVDVINSIGDTNVKHDVGGR